MINKEPGLQAERTSLSWLRTYLVLLGSGILALKLYKQSQSVFVGLIGMILVSYALFLSYYTQKRFNQFFLNKSIVNNKDILIKKVLSIIIMATSIGYEIYSLTEFSL